MKHRIFGKKLGRTHNQRQALLTGLVRNIFLLMVVSRLQMLRQNSKSVSAVERLSSTLMSKPELIAKRGTFYVLTGSKLGQSSLFLNAISICRPKG